jgi:hypothetical protein
VLTYIERRGLYRGADDSDTTDDTSGAPPAA